MRKSWSLPLLMVLGFMVGMLLPNVSGCWPFSVPSVTINAPGDKPEAKPEVKPSDKPKSVEQLEKELADAKKVAAEADAKVDAKKKELDDAIVTHRQHELYWLVGILFLTMLGCVAGAVYLTGLRKWFIYGALTCAGLMLLCLGVAAILPYMAYILVGFFTVAAIVLFAWWRLDHKAVQQITTAVETFKDKMPGYKEHFTKIIDTDADAWITRTRKNLGLLTAKAK
jgi:hypothetical protein